MKSIYLFVIICLFASCDFQKTRKTNYSENSDRPIENISVMDFSEQTDSQESNPEILELPVMGSFELTTMKIDSVNEYGAGDCWGTVIRLSLPHCDMEFLGSWKM